MQKRWPLVAALTACVAVAVAFYTLGQAKIYQTTASVLIDPNPPRPLGKDVSSDVGTGSYWTNREYYTTQIQLIESRRIAAETVRALGLNRDPTFMENRRREAQPSGPEVDVETAVTTLLSRLSVEPIKDTRLIDVKYEDADPERARRILSTHLDIYIQKNVDDAVTDTGNAAEWMRGQLEKLRAELDHNEMALHEYKEKNGILSLSLDDQTAIFRDQMGQLSQALTTARAEKEKIAARASELDKVNPEDPEHLSATELLSSPIIGDLRTRYVDLKLQRDALLASGKGENHPEVRAATASVAQCREALMVEVRNVQNALKGDLAAVQKEAAGLVQLGEDAKGHALDLNLLEIDYRKLDRSRKNTERLLDLVLERSKDMDLSSQMRFNNIRVSDSPSTPKKPIRPNVLTNLGGGLAAGLLLGVVAAISREQLDRTIKSPEDLGRFGLTYLGLLPRMDGPESQRPVSRRHRRREILEAQPGSVPELRVHSDPRSAIAEAARSIRTNLLFMSPDVPYRRLLVTSAVPTEGKTTVACSIAIAMAQAGQRVILIDCDLRRPRLHRIFGNPNEQGLTSVLLEPEALEGVILGTEVPNLQLLTSGPIPPNPAELLQSDSFSRLLQELEKRFDRIVFDSPPLMPVTDAAILSTRVDGTVLVVKPFTTRKDVARHAVRALSDVGGKILGAVLNNLDLQRRDYGYYQYSRYYTYRQDAPSPRAEGDEAA